SGNRSPAAELGDLRSELVDSVLPDDHRGDEDLLARGNAGAIALQSFFEQRYRPLAEFERLLHHGADDRARLHARQRLIVFVEGDDLDLTDLAGVAHGVEDCGSV